MEPRGSPDSRAGPCIGRVAGHGFRSTKPEGLASYTTTATIGRRSRIRNPCSFLRIG